MSAGAKQERRRQGRGDFSVALNGRAFFAGGVTYGAAGHHGPGPARLSRHPAELVLLDDGIGVRIIRKADGGRRPKTIWEISVEWSSGKNRR